MPKTALIVEDEIFVALDMERILHDAGYVVSAIAADAKDAMAAAPGCAMAFVDVNLRDGMTGPGIAERLTRDFGIKVVFVTANPGQIGDAPVALGYIRKPFTERAILAAAALASGGSEQPDDADFVPLTADDQPGLVVRTRG